MFVKLRCPVLTVPAISKDCSSIVRAWVTAAQPRRTFCAFELLSPCQKGRGAHLKSVASKKKHWALCSLHISMLKHLLEGLATTTVTALTLALVLTLVPRSVALWLLLLVAADAHRYC